MEKGKKTVLLGWILLLGISCVYYFANLQKVLVPAATFNELQRIFDGNAAAVTALGAAFMYSYAIMQLVTGLLADRYCGARVIAVGGILFCIGSLLSAYEKSFAILMVSRALTGMGAATVYLSAVKEINRIAPNSLPILMGVLLFLGYSGSVTGTRPFMAAVPRYGYHTMMLWAGIGVAISYLIYIAIYIPSSLPPVRKEVKFSPVPYIEVLKRKHNLAQIGMCGIAFGTYYAFQSVIGKKFLEDYCGMSAASAGTVLTITMIIASINGFIVANISRLWGNRRRPFLLFEGFGCMVTALSLTILLLCDSHSPVIAVAIFIFQAFACNVGSMTVAMYRDANEEHRFGTVMSISNCFAYLVTAVFGGFLGKLMDLFPPTIVNGVKIYGRNSYLTVFAVFFLLGVIAATLACFLRESYGKNIAKELS